jgi:hypothetical protein
LVILKEDEKKKKTLSNGLGEENFIFVAGIKTSEPTKAVSFILLDKASG